ncbi:MAG TPA: hypothetical protein VKV28_07830 [Candidatus Binataceae bacterium]|nr:hypothetical protein [Candidatus Binataceae bacterium]
MPIPAVSVLRVTLVLGGSVVYLALAVLGWGGPTAFFSHAALVILMLAAFALVGAALFAAEI